MQSFLYQYIIGGIVFFAGVYFGFRQGYLGFEGKKLKNLLVTIGGLAFFMMLQGTMQFAQMSTATPKQAAKSVAIPTLGNTTTYIVMAAYFIIILAIGTIWGKESKNTKDFFFGGQRFSWWLIAFSLVATTVGSYSFVKYSKVAYKYGLSSSQTYLNDWFWFPLLVFGWLPILYFSKIKSIPEYFERRFNPLARQVVTYLLLFYMIGYIGVNLYTMGKALNYLVGWSVPTAAIIVASVSAVYVTMGGQTSVIMTDLFQGVMLFACGLLIVYLGAEHLGGISKLWDHLPRGHRMAFANFNKDPSFPSVGIFWQDAMANSAMFYFLNQGILMRFMAARSIHASRRSVLTVFLVLMPVAAVVVASGGWVAKALVHAGYLQPMPPEKAFFVAAKFLSTPMVFGLVMAALTAALMSTVDTLITAIAAIVVNDIYKPNNPEASEKKLLKVARISSVGVTVLGVALVPLFMAFDSIYSAHASFTAALTPPLVVALLLGVFWKRFSAKAAIATMLGGMFFVFLSILYPSIIAPFAHGVPMKKVTTGFLAGAKQFKFMRAFFGLSVSFIIGVVTALLTKPEKQSKIAGLVWGTVDDAIRMYKGSKGTEKASPWYDGKVKVEPALEDDTTADFEAISLSITEAQRLGIKEGDLLYCSDPRWWLGGLRSGHAIVAKLMEEKAEEFAISPGLMEKLKGSSVIRYKVLYSE